MFLSLWAALLAAEDSFTHDLYSLKWELWAVTGVLGASYILRQYSTAKHSKAIIAVKTLLEGIGAFFGVYGAVWEALEALQGRYYGMVNLYPSHLTVGPPLWYFMMGIGILALLGSTYIPDEP